MIKPFRSILEFCALILSLSISSAHASDIHAYTENLPPLNYMAQNQAQGYSVELLQLLCQNAGVSVNIKVLPWARAVATAGSDHKSLLFSLTRTPEREEQYQWLGPISKRRILLMKLQSAQRLQITSLAQAKQYRVGAVRESATAKLLQAQGFQANQSLDLSDSDAINVKKLLNHRVDIIGIWDMAAVWQAQQQGFNNQQLSTVMVLDEGSEFYFAAHKDFNAQLFKKLSIAFNHLKTSGKLAKLQHKYAI